MKTIPLTRRRKALFVEAGKLIVEKGECICRTSHQDFQVPVQRFAALFVGPGCSITHAFIRRCAESKCYVIWTSSQATSIYSAFGTHHQKPQKILEQSRIHDSADRRLKAARLLYSLQFDAQTKASSVGAIRGSEGQKMKKLYKFLARKYGMLWVGRSTSGSWSNTDSLNKAISRINAWLYGIVEAMILILGYSPSIGVIHANKPRSFVYDIADTLKPKFYLPFVFKNQKENPDIDRKEWKRKFIRFTEKKAISKKIVSNIRTVMSC